MRHLLKAFFVGWVLLLKTACNGTAVCAGLTCVAACLGAACNGTAPEPIVPPVQPPPRTSPPPFNAKPSENLCEAQRNLAAKLGTEHLIIGIMTEGGGDNYENAISGVPYGLKYIYVAERARAGGPCTDCNNCPNQPPGGWWGCWNRTGNDSRPGARLRNLFSSSADAGQIPMVVYYTIYRTIAEGAGALPGGLRVTENVRDYFRDWRFTLQVVNEYQQQSGKPVMVHVEPDLWGFAQQGSVGRNSPKNLPVNVQEAAEGDCPEQENNFAGFGICMLRMARHHAPQASIGFMASAWATGLGDISRGVGSSATINAEAAGRSTGLYLNELGANLADFLVVEFSDRDAGYYAANREPDRWYFINPDEGVPNFRRTFLWARTLAETVKLPLVWWQIPMGHSGMENVNPGGSCFTGRWRDNRAEYLFEHLDEVVTNHGVALAFGPGDCRQTNPRSDDGFLAGKVRDYEAGAKQKLICVQ